MLKKIKISKFIGLIFSACLVFSSTSCSSTGNSPQSSNQENTENSDNSQEAKSNSLSSTLDPQNPIDITFWHYYGGGTQEFLDGAVLEFNATIGKEKGIIVDAVSQGSILNLQSALSQAAEGVIYAESMPNIFLSYPDTALYFVEDDLLADFNDLFTNEERAIFVDDFLKEGVIQDKQIILPIVKSTELLLLNDTHWIEFAEETGHVYEELETWEGIFEVAQSYYNYTDAKTPDIKNDGKALLGLDSLSNYIMVGNMQMGIDIIDAKNEQLTFGEEALEKSFELFAKSIALGYFTSIGKFRSDDVRSGSILGYTGSSASLGYFPQWVEIDNQKVDINWKTLPYPIFENGEVYVCSQGAGLCVTKSDAQSEEASAEFLKYLTSPEINIQFALTTEYFPVVNDFYSEDAVEQSLYDIFGERADNEDTYTLYYSLLEQFNSYKLYSTDIFSDSYTVREELPVIYGEGADLLTQKISEMRKDAKLSDDEIIENLNIDEELNYVKESISETFRNFTIEYK